MIEPVEMSQFGPPNGELITQGRDHRGVTIDALAEASGVSARRISCYERGLEQMPSGDLIKIAEALDVPPSFFYRALKKKRPVSKSESVGGIFDGDSIARRSSEFGKSVSENNDRVQPRSCGERKS